MSINFSPEKAKFQNAIYGKDVRSALVSMADKCQELANSGGGSDPPIVPVSAEDLVADAFSNSSSKQYTVGDYVVYDNTFWRCTGDTTGGTFNSNKWEATTVGKRLEILDDASGSGGTSSSDIEDMIAPAFSNDSEDTYGVGNYVTYNDNLFRCIAPTTGGTFDVSKWTETAMGIDVFYNNTNTSNLAEDVANIKNMVAYTYTESNSYNAGSYVVYNNVVYKCLVNGATGPFDESKWRMTNIGSEISSIGGGSGGSTNNTIIADLYSNSSSDHYSIGDHVIYSNKLYVCRTPTTGGVFDGSKWRQVTVMEEVEQNTEDIEGMIISQGQSANLNIASTYVSDLSLQRPIGQCVIYNGLLYQCTETHSASTFDESKWDCLNLDEIIRALIGGNWNPNKEYAVGDYVGWFGKIYKCNTTRPAATDRDFIETYWDETSIVEVIMELYAMIKALSS